MSVLFIFDKIAKTVSLICWKLSLWYKKFWTCTTDQKLWFFLRVWSNLFWFFFKWQVCPLYFHFLFLLFNLTVSKLKKEKNHHILTYYHPTQPLLTLNNSIFFYQKPLSPPLSETTIATVGKSTTYTARNHHCHSHLSSSLTRLGFHYITIVWSQICLPQSTRLPKI